MADALGLQEGVEGIIKWVFEQCLNNLQLGKARQLPGLAGLKFTQKQQSLPVSAPVSTSFLFS